MASRVTIKSIAQDLGISHMTVSRALSGNPNVRKDTRDAIMKRAAELGYVKSAAATAMRGDGTRIVGLLLPNITNEFYAAFANALALLCEERDLHLTIHLTNDDAERERQSIRRLRGLQAGAVITVPAPGEVEDEQNALQEMQVIQLIRTRSSQKTPWALLVEDGISIGGAVDHLVRAGHRNIGYIGADRALSSGRQRLNAFHDAMLRNQITPNATLIHTGAPSFEMGHQSAASMIDDRMPITAMICGGFEISNGALDACLQRDIRFPQDLAFVGYGDPSFYEWIEGGITTIALPVKALALQAAAFLAPDSSHQGAQQMSFRSSFVVRNSA